MTSPLNRNSLKHEEAVLIDSIQSSPITILQIGEGNFLRGFFDWMLQQCRKQGLYDGSIAVTQPRAQGRAKIEELASQDGLYTLVIRGLENGKSVERTDVISVFNKVFDPYSNWEQYLALAADPELKFVVSNTTEAGLVYRPESITEGEPIHSYPGKLTKLLYERFVYFDGAPERGLICLPCELLERNGDELRSCVLRYCEDWGYPDSFKQWIMEHNRFLNSLVDRIVTGYPDEATAEGWFQEWGYSDPLLTTAEPYHLWAIEGEPELDELLPLRKAGLNVHWVSDLKPFQQRKVRILNGAHTLMTPLGILYGLEHVRETMEHSELGPFIRRSVEDEIIPALPYSGEELAAYANDVYERFLNPYIRHRLSDIAMNSLSKFKTRLLPTMLHYTRNDDKLPNDILCGFAGLLRYYRVNKTEQGYTGRTFAGKAYVVRDDGAALKRIAEIWSSFEQQSLTLQSAIGELLALDSIWGSDLNAACPSLASAIANHITEMERTANEQLG